MVAITVMVSGVLLFMVLGMMDPEGVSPTGVLDVKKDGQVEDRFEISVKALTFSIPAEEAFLAVNGQKPLRGLGSYPSSSPYSGNGFTYNTGQTSPSQIGTGSRVFLDLSESLRGSVITVQLVKHNGAVMASTKFFVAGGTPGQTTIDMSLATWKNGTAASFPLVFDGSDDEHVILPHNTIVPPTRYFNVSCMIMLNSPPSSQDNWATIINLNADNGYRLQLSGSGNDWFEFGARNYWARSDGVQMGTPVPVKEGIQYQIWGIFDFELRKVSIWVNATGDLNTMVLAGIRDYNRNEMPIYQGDWRLGDRSFNDRSFDGVVYWLNVETI